MGILSCEIQVWEGALRQLGLRNLVSLTLGGEKLLVPAQGDDIHLITRVNLNSHQLHTILGGELEPGIERNLAIRYSLSQQGTFRLSQGSYAVCWDYLKAVLGVLEGGTLVMRSVKLMGGALRKGLWEVLWDWLWLGLWWHDCLLGDWLEHCPLHQGLLFLGDLAHLGLLVPLELLSPCQGVLWDGSWILFH